MRSITCEESSSRITVMLNSVPNRSGFDRVDHWALDEPVPLEVEVRRREDLPGVARIVLTELAGNDRGSHVPALAAHDDHAAVGEQ